MESQQLHESYAIGDVIRILATEFPDLTPSTLRFLEQQGLLKPTRPAGGHRRYSEDDLSTIRTIRNWQRHRLTLAEIGSRLVRRVPRAKYAEVVSSMTRHVAHGEVRSAVQLLDDMYASGTPLIDICHDLLRPTLVSLGSSPTADPSHVDRQLEFDEAVIAFLARAESTRDAVPYAGVVVGACPTWERHDLGVRMLMSLLVERGVRAHFLGPCTEARFVIDAVLRVTPDVTFVSMTDSAEGDGNRVWLADVLAEIPEGSSVMIGGQMAASLPDPGRPNVHVVPPATPIADVIERYFALVGKAQPS